MRKDFLFRTKVLVGVICALFLLLFLAPAPGCRTAVVGPLSSSDVRAIRVAVFRERWLAGPTDGLGNMRLGQLLGQIKDRLQRPITKIELIGTNKVHVILARPRFGELRACDLLKTNGEWRIFMGYGM